MIQREPDALTVLVSGKIAGERPVKLSFEGSSVGEVFV